MTRTLDLRGIETRKRRRADGSVRETYRVRWVAPDGSRPGETFTDPEKAIEERDRLEAMAEAMTAGTPARANATVADLHARWRSEHVVRELAPRTIANYDRAWGELEGRIGGRVAVTLTRRDIKELRLDMLDDGIGPTSVNQKLAMLHGICQYALEDELLDVNPVSGVRKVKRPRRSTQVKNIPSLLEVERARAYAARELHSPITAMLISVGVFLGLRPSEWRALRWFDLGEDTMTVAHVAEPDGSLRAGDKNFGAGRTISVPSFLDDLAAWRELTPYPAATDPIVPRGDGGHWTEEDYKNWAGRKLRRSFAAVGAKATPYDLRHTAISLLIQEGRLSLMQIAQRHGNSIEMISRHYAHVIAAYASGKIELPEEVAAARRLAASSSLFAQGVTP